MLENLRNLIATLSLSPGTSRPDHSLPVAACAIFLEAAWADDHFATSDREHILAALERHFSLSREEALEVLESAAALHRSSPDLFRFTRQVNEALSVPEKIRLVEEVWHILLADGQLTGYEDRLAHKLQALLNLNHPQLIQAKLTARAALAAQEGS